MRNNIKTLVLIFALSNCSLTTFAANTSGDEDLSTFANPGEPGADPGAPINDYLIPMLVLGVVLAFWLVSKTPKGKNTSAKISG